MRTSGDAGSLPLPSRANWRPRQHRSLGFGTGGRADPSAHCHHTSRVGVRLELLERLAVSAVRAAAGTAVANPQLDLALRFGSSRRTRIGVETKSLRLALVDRVDRPPRSGPGHHCGLLIVDPDRGRNSAQALQRRVVHRPPCEEMFALAPHQPPRPRKGKGEQERDGQVLPAEFG